MAQRVRSVTPKTLLTLTTCWYFCYLEERHWDLGEGVDRSDGEDQERAKPAIRANRCNGARTVTSPGWDRRNFSSEWASLRYEMKLQPYSFSLRSEFTFYYFNIGELQQDYLAKRELESLIDETETSFQKINESIKTLICVVQKQEKHLLVKTAGKWTFWVRNKSILAKHFF